MNLCEATISIDKRAQITCSCISAECGNECLTGIDKRDFGGHSSGHVEAADIDKHDFGALSKCCLRTSAGRLACRTQEHISFLRKVGRFSECSGASGARNKSGPQASTNALNLPIPASLRSARRSAPQASTNAIVVGIRAFILKPLTSINAILECFQNAVCARLLGARPPRRSSSRFFAGR